MLLLLVATTAVAQQGKTISGVIVDNNGETVIGANVTVDGTSNGTITNLDGEFKLQNVAENAKLKVSYIGYNTQVVSVAGKTNFRIVLEEDSQALEEVVVIGYGSVKKTTLTSAVSKMDAKGIENRPLARPETALQGQLAGVAVRSVSGEPGADMQIRVRGAASINASSDPLYVVDGVPITTLSGINPADIQSIEVLKDASSAAIYGSRGSNGVVLVTTKKGKSGKPQISFNASYGFQTMEKKLDLLSATEWMEFRTRWNDASYLSAARGRGVEASISDSNSQRMAKLGLTAANYNYMLDERWFNYMSDETKASHNYTATSEGLSLLDWQDEFYRTAAIQDYSLTVSGATEHTNYLFSGGYLNQEGLATGTDYERAAFRANIESKINKYIAVGVQLAPTYIKRNGSGLANGKDSRSHTVLSSTPVSEPGVGYMTNVEPNVRYLWAGNAPSPVYYMQKNIRKDEMVRMLGNAFLRITPLKGLRIELSGSVNYYDYQRSSYTYSSTGSTWTAGEGTNSSGGHNTSRTWSTLLQALVNYDATFGKHTINAMAGTSSEQSNVGFSTDQTFNKPFPNDAIVYSFDGSKVAIGTDKVTQATPNKLASVFGRLQYSFDERYVFSGSLRYDGGSVFGANNKWGLFPALSGAWIMSNENFFKNINLSWFSTLKLRASYGVTGNNSISATAAYPTLTAVTYGGMSGYNSNTLGNMDLGWEKTHSTDIAVDFGFLDNRIQLSLDWYTKNTKDLLYQVPSLGASGFSTVWSNIGNIKNRGFEVELNTRNFAGAFSWNTSFNLGFNKNKVISIGIDNTPIYSGQDNSSNVLMVGKPVNCYYMYEAIGVWKTQQEIDDYSAKFNGQKVTFQGTAIKPGDIRYRDVNDDGVFDKENDRAIMGSPTPKFTYGMTNTFSYKDFDLSILLTAQSGGKIYGLIGRAIDRPGMGATGNVLGHWRNAWWSETEQGDGKTPYILSSTTGTTVDTRWLYSSDYLRVKNITLGYKLPINPKIISYARIYASIENLAKWDNYYGGYSPESANNGSGPGGQSALGLDYSSYPTPRIITFGVNINF
ncbi:TonB-dependent receptor [Bacteroides sp. 214]|uniref:SusC/RagA family TonB-linked outer membrane protein n=1 Tax=Bacteroides sp. 214 TaxID=2302935 RepID=UPI0013D06430|nr:TonB-dependent receptor [Bacteroides sp. 214]NDW11480.1 TonB-dependent receptor [Bacteroides sp. 214]